ncbi:MAG: hypothetical protein KDD64_11000, partial [Bdellovibrionales bacterium]|nr:hypothetical protein [Bdellovibrionales bacterium]
LMFSVGAGTLCFLVFLPWLVKNMIWIGNPVHPLFRSLFEHVARTPGGVGMASPLKRFGLYGEDFLDYLLTPFRMLFFGMDDSPQWFDGQLTPILVLGFLAILGISKSKHRIFLLLVTVSYVYLGLFLSGPRIRYLLPVLVPWVLLCVSGLKELGNFGTEKQRPQIYGILLTLHLLFSGYYVVDLAHRKKAIPYFAGALNEEDYVSLYVPEYSLAKFANSKLQGKGTIYLLYTGNRFWVYDVPIISGGYQSAGLLLQWLERARDASEFSKDLQNRGIHYILANGPLTARALREVFLREGPELAQKWQEFQSSLVLIQQDGPYGLFEIPSGAIDSPLPEKESEWTIKN